MHAERPPWRSSFHKPVQAPRAKHRRRNRKRRFSNMRRAAKRHTVPKGYASHDRSPHRHRRGSLDPTHIAARHKALRPEHRRAAPGAAPAAAPGAAVRPLRQRRRHPLGGLHPHPHPHKGETSSNLHWCHAPPRRTGCTGHAIARPPRRNRRGETRPELKLHIVHPRVLRPHLGRHRPQRRPAPSHEPGRPKVYPYRRHRPGPKAR